MLHKHSTHTILLTLLVFSLTAIAIQAAPVGQTILTSPRPIPDQSKSPLPTPTPTPAFCPYTTNWATLEMDAKVYASDLEVDLDTAICRLMLQDLAGGLDAELATREVDTYAGLWIQHVPQFRIIVQFTHSGKKTIGPYIENGPLADIVDVKAAQFSIAELEAAQTGALLNIRALNTPVESGINVFENRVELYVIERSQFNTALREARIRLPDNVDVVTVNEFSTDTVDIYGGLALSTCTSGFSVVHSNGTHGIITAAHCANSQSYNGTALPFQGSAYGASYDVQWHSAPGFTVRNLAYDGSGNRYIYSTKHRNNQALNAWVCKYGKTTGYGCGYIIDKNYQPTVPGSWSSTFIRVHRDGIDLSEPGDSGGPWFLGNTAYGIMKSQIGNDAVYMAINYVDFLDLTVLPVRIYLPLVLKE